MNNCTRCGQGLSGKGARCLYCEERDREQAQADEQIALALERLAAKGRLAWRLTTPIDGHTSTIKNEPVTLTRTDR